MAGKIDEKGTNYNDLTLGFHLLRKFNVVKNVPGQFSRN